MQASYSGKSVIRAGELIRSTYDGDQQAQAVDWVLLDIFAPFRAEYERQEYPPEFGGPVEFGSLWNKWVDDVIAAAQALKHFPAPDAKDAFAVSGTSPTDENDPSAPAKPAPDTTPPVQQCTARRSTAPAPTNSSTARSNVTSQNSEVSNG